jgi:hypothetical protein
METTMKDENYYIAKGYRWTLAAVRSGRTGTPSYWVTMSSRTHLTWRVSEIIPKEAMSHFEKGLALYDKLEGLPLVPLTGTNKLGDTITLAYGQTRSPWVGLLSTPPEELTGKQGITSGKHTRSGTSCAISDKTTTILPFGSATKSGPNAQ